MITKLMSLIGWMGLVLLLPHSGQATPQSEKEAAPNLSLLSPATLKTIGSVRAGMTFHDLQRVFFPQAGRQFWAESEIPVQTRVTYEYHGPLRPFEAQILRGWVVKVDVEFGLRASPMPSIMCPPRQRLTWLNGQAFVPGNRIIRVSAPYLGPPGPIRLESGGPVGGRFAGAIGPAY